MDKLMEGRTSFIIAHRLSTVVDCNQIFVLNEGKIIENGTHQQLISQNGMYSKMFGDYQKSVEWKIEN
jgi:ATP-binding cassette subfamily B protein